MAFTDITSTASVRAVLGVSEKEIRDDVLVDPIYSVRLTENLYDISPDLFTDFTEVAALTTRTSAQQRFFDLTQTYSAYLVASFCTNSAEMFAPKTIKDSKSEITRIDDPFKNMRNDVLATLAILRDRLIDAYSTVNPDLVVVAKTARIMVTAAPLGVNPVTGA